MFYVNGLLCHYYGKIFISLNNDVINVENPLFQVKRKSFEIEYVFKPGKAPVPPAPTPPPPPPPGVEKLSRKTPKSSPKIEKAEKVPKDPGQCGFTGLINVGNTCFMASVLQESWIYFHIFFGIFEFFFNLKSALQMFQLWGITFDLKTLSRI